MMHVTDVEFWNSKVTRAHSKGTGRSSVTPENAIPHLYHLKLVLVLFLLMLAIGHA